MIGVTTQRGLLLRTTDVVVAASVNSYHDCVQEVLSRLCTGFGLCWMVFGCGGMVFGRLCSLCEP
jgi:hypothetical protein